VAVEAGNLSGAGRVTAAVGILMTIALSMAAIEAWLEGLPMRQALLALGAACACAAWCLRLVRRSRRADARCLRIAPDGKARLVDRVSGESVDAEVMVAWGLGRLIYLCFRPVIKVDSKVDSDTLGEDRRESVLAAGAKGGTPVASPFGTGDYRLLLVRGCFSESQWHGLRRWLVWYRRSGHAESAAV
jgi:hypothetical protein